MEFETELEGVCMYAHAQHAHRSRLTISTSPQVDAERGILPRVSFSAGAHLFLYDRAQMRATRKHRIKGHRPLQERTTGTPTTHAARDSSLAPRGPSRTRVAYRSVTSNSPCPCYPALCGFVFRTAT